MPPVLPCDIDDRYTVLSELGTGSHAIVYRATDRLLGRDVALKVLRPELVNSDVSERFRREIRLTARLEHPHIARVYGTGDWDGQPYFVTALARGMSLADRLQKEHQLPVDQAVRIVREIASALAYAHSEGVVHRDVKPANILLTPDGALLTDFGVARAFQGTTATAMTATGMIVGTVAYMSPEQICGEGVDERSDQYALALVLYEILAGVPPHVAATMEGLLGQRVIGQQLPVRAHRPSVPAVLDEIVAQALAPAAADRFHSMTEFAAALDLSSDLLKSGTRFVAPEAAAARRSTAATPAAAAPPRGGARRTWIAGGIGAAALLGFGAFGITRWRAAPAAAAAGTAPSVFSITADGDASRAAPVVLALTTELGAWSGISVGNGDDGTLLATRVTPADGGITVLVTVRHPDGSTLPTGTVQAHFPAVAPLDPDSLRVLAARVLVASMVPPDSVELPYAVKQRATAAVQAYAGAWRTLRSGAIDEAQRGFATAAPVMPQAALWTALLGAWRQPRDVPAWRDAASEIASRASELSRADSLVAVALQHRATGRIAEGIAALTQATAAAPTSFAAWYTLGDALRLDGRVVPDAASPTGARFASSWWGATDAYRRAIDLLPADGLVPLFGDLPTTTFALNGSRRAGRSEAGEGEAYAGLPGMSGDSVVVFPMPVRVFTAGTARVPETYQAAIRTGRARLLQLATALARRAPTSVVARLAYARALEYAGMLNADGANASALSTLDSAMALARTRDDSLDVGTSEMRVRLRLGDFAGAHAVSTRLLDRATSASVDVAPRLASIATLVGRTALAESLLVRGSTLAPTRTDGVPGAVAASLARYTIAAATGACTSLTALRASAVGALQSHYSRAELPSAVQRWVAPGDWMRITCADAPLPEGAAPGDPLLRAVSALHAGQKSGAADAVRAMAAGRDGAATSAVSWDTRFAELWVLVQSGDTVTARDQLGSALDEISGTLDYILFDLAQGAGLRRSLALCEEIAVAGSARPSREKCRDALKALSGG